MKSILLIVMATLALAGCAAGPAYPTRAEASRITTRTYSGATQEQVVAAAERVLRLADGDDFQLARRADGFLANRPWQLFMLGWAVGNDVWIFQSWPREGGAVASITVGSYFTGKGLQRRVRLAAEDATSLPPTYKAVEGTSLYDLFWSRVDYLLGLRDTWPTCKEADARIEAKATWGMNDALCNSFNMTDATPAGPMLARR